MRSLKAPWKDYRRRRLLRRHGIAAVACDDLFTAGERSGSWTVRRRGLDEHSVVYSFGVGDNVAWDVALIQTFGCVVHAFDPTPVAASFVAATPLPERFRFEPVGLAAFDGGQAFAPPRKASDCNFAPATDDGSGAHVTLPVRRLSTLARERGHACIDVLKLDIEGGELEVLPDVLASGLEVRQLLVEFHHDRPGGRFEDTLEALHALERAGYEIVHISNRGLEFSFALGQEAP